jgi:hypothetical protein
MKRVAIEIDGVLRDTFAKLEQIYQKFLIDELELVDEDFKFEIKKPFDTKDFTNHFVFKNEEEFVTFVYEEFAMEIFGHAQSSEYNTFIDLNEIYISLRDNHDLLIVSDEIGKSKPASLFFLSKFGCLVEKVKFYSNSTINSMWDEIDLLLTSNPALLLEHPEDKIVIKYQTGYNKHIKSNNSIITLKELEFELTKLI